MVFFFILAQSSWIEFSAVTNASQERYLPQTKKKLKEEIKNK